MGCGGGDGGGGGDDDERLAQMQELTYVWVWACVYYLKIEALRLARPVLRIHRDDGDDDYERLVVGRKYDKKLTDDDGHA